MSIQSRMEKLESLMPVKNKDILLYAKHVVSSLEDFEEHHRRLVAAQAIAGIRPKGGEEETFYTTLQQMKEQVISTLEWTVDDLQHKGDKRYDKHFADGVE